MSSALTAKENFRLSRWLVSRYGGRVRDFFNSFVVKSSLIEDKAVFDAAEFDYLKPLEDGWQQIRQEADAVLSDVEAVPPLGDISPDHQRLDYTRRWRAYFLWGYGIRVDDHCAQCPITTAFVEKIPGLLTAMFSVHQSGAHLPRHRGVTKGMLTYHLGLHIPNENNDCYINVESTSYHWQEGKFFVFDDTYHHEVFNNSMQSRVILLLHIRRPLRFPGSWAQNIFFWGIKRSPFVQDAKRNFGV